MPYFVYELMPFGALVRLEEFDKYQAASSCAKNLRKERGKAALSRIKVIFAANELEAEDLLCRVTEPEVTGDD